jgi:hypothetical protein
MDFKDYYEILGVPPNADKKIIQQTYRQLEAEMVARMQTKTCVWLATAKPITRPPGSKGNFRNDADLPKLI